MADTFYSAIRAKGLIGSWDNASSYEQAWKDVPVTEVDNLVGIYQAKYLMSDWPFQPEKIPFNPPDPDNYIDKLAIDIYREEIPWSIAMNKLLVYYQKERDYNGAAKIAFMLAQPFPFWDKPQYIAGQLLVKVKRYREAVFYLDRAVNLKPDNTTYLLSLSLAYALNSQKGPAQSTLQRLLDIEPDHEEANRLLKQVETSSKRSGS